jgi:hypothetical protein
MSRQSTGCEGPFLILEACGPSSSNTGEKNEGKRRRAKKTAVAVSLLHLWGLEEQAAFKDFLEAIMKSMTLAFPGSGKRICVLTDASDRFYAGLVRHIHEVQMNLSMEEQDHQLLAFLPG